jgi:hypothetical protein
LAVLAAATELAAGDPASWTATEGGLSNGDLLSSQHVLVVLNEFLKLDARDANKRLLGAEWPGFNWKQPRKK